MTVRRGWVVIAALALLPAGCADPVEQQWQDRASLPTCGAVDLHQGEALKQDARDEVACLKDALDSGEGGELRVEYPTVEGDPITAYYRVTPDGGTEIYEDSTADPNGSQEWSFGSCPTPAGALDVAC